MAALQDLDLAHAQAQTTTDVKVLMPFIGAAFWWWLVDHWNDTILKRQIFLFKVTLKVRDCYPLFVRLFGEPPATVASPVGGWPR